MGITGFEGFEGFEAQEVNYLIKFKIMKKLNYNKE